MLNRIVPAPQSLLGRIVRLPLHLVPRNTTVPVLAGINRGMRWVTGTGPNNGCWIGNYEADHASSLSRFVQLGMIAYDVGANAGFYTLALSRLVGDTGRVVAFEPEAGNAHALRRHLELNHLHNVIFVQTAVSDAPGMVGFSGGILSGRGAITSVGSYQVPSSTLNDFVAAGNPFPSFIKMDIEGAECAALEGATSILERKEAVWMLATHSYQLRVRCCEILTRYGYRFTAFDGISDPDGARDFLAIPARHESV